MVLSLLANSHNSILLLFRMLSETCHYFSGTSDVRVSLVIDDPQDYCIISDSDNFSFEWDLCFQIYFD